MEVAAAIIVKGLVQGVGFRYFVARIAHSVGVRGYVRNLYNGDVEIMVEGNRGAIEELVKETKVGPRAAHVTDLKIEWKEPDYSFTGFEIR